MTPLHAAVVNDRTSVIVLLLNHGADISVMDRVLEVILCLF
jgi:ankyrin repeat protein